MDYKNQN